MEANKRVQMIFQMLEKTPDDCFLNHALGLEYLKEGNREKAIHLFEKVLSIDENYIGTYYHLALSLFPVDPERSRQVFEKGMQKTQELKELHALNELSRLYEDLFEVG